MRRAFLALAAGLTLSGCIVLNSKAPLIAQSDADTGITPGTWLSYPGFPPAQANQLAPGDRAKCFDSPYRVPPIDPMGQPVAERGPLVYCPFDTNEQHAPSKAFTLTATADGFVARAPGEKQDLKMRVRRLNDSFLITQLDMSAIKAQMGATDTDIGGFVYVLFRPHGSDLELHVVPCDSGLPLEDAKDGKPKAPPPPPPHLKCAVKSLEAIRPDLLAYAASPDAAPVVILRRTGD